MGKPWFRTKIPLHPCYSNILEDPRTSGMKGTFQKLLPASQLIMGTSSAGDPVRFKCLLTLHTKTIAQRSEKTSVILLLINYFQSLSDFPLHIYLKVRSF